MKTIVRLKMFSPLRAGLATLALAVASMAATALASTASNTTISNTATVNYNDAGGAPQAAVTSLAATVTVTLVPSAVNVSSPVAQTISQGATASLVYTITSTANGPDTYALSVPVSASNLSAVTATFTTPVSFGGSTLAAALVVGSTTITVPYDGVVSNANVNGLAPGSTITIGGVVYTIAAGGINKTNSTTTNTVVVTLTSAITAGTVAAVGSIIGEQKLVTVTVPSGTVIAGGSGTQTASLTATANTGPNPATTQGTPTVITVNRPTLAVTKLVSTDGGVTFGASGSAAPGVSLIYKITASNSGASNGTAVQFTDVVPPFLTYVPGSGKSATLAATTYAAATTLTEGAGGYSFTAGTSTVNYNPGGATGTVAGGGVLILFFRATIN